jgi:ABC-2 type transport system ATP-binding protein
MSKKTLDEKINSTLELVSLEKWSRKKIGKFSKGMKQRLALASALIHEPPILILDEPTTGLDPRGSVEIREIINSLKKSGKTIFFSSHLLNEVQETCDEIALIDKGKLIRQAEISDLEGKLTKIEIATLKPIDDYQMKLILKIEGVESAEVEGDKFTISISGDKQQRANLLKKLQKIGLEIISFKPSSDLESLYMDHISESVR